MKRKSGSHGFARLAVGILSVLLGVTLLSLGLWARGSSAQESKHRCGETGVGPGTVPAGEEPALLKLDPDDQPAIQFLEDRSPGWEELEPDIVGEAPPAATPVRIEARLFRKSDGGKSLPPGQVVISRAEVSSNQRRVEIVVCVDPAQPFAVKAGSYSGHLVVDDPAFSPAELPMTVTLRHPSAGLPIVLAALGVVIGVASQSLLSLFRSRKEKTLFNRWELVIGIVFAGIAAAPVYVSQFEKDPAWSVDASHVVALVLSVAGAASVAYSAPAAAVPRKPQERNGTGSGPVQPK